MEKRKKKILTAILSLLLIAVYLMIFRLSADNGENSSRISMKVSKTAVSLYYRLRGGRMDDAAFVTGAAACVEGAVRKLAHFTEYMAVGFLSGGIWCLWVADGQKRTAGVLIQLLVSAGLDELHQYFVPGRHASLRDVMIDVLGGCAGFAIVLCLKGLTKVWNHIRRRESETCF